MECLGRNGRGTLQGEIDKKTEKFSNQFLNDTMMKKLLIIVTRCFLTVLILSSYNKSQAQNSDLSKIEAGTIPAKVSVPQLGKSSVEEVLNAMTLKEKATMVVGYLHAIKKGNSSGLLGSEIDFDYPGLGFAIPQVKRLGIPATIVSDGSYGLRRYMPISRGVWGTTAFPVPILVACTWNLEAAETQGVCYGKEGKEAGVDVLLGPAMNIHRDPLCGRNFEYFSEDPLLSGKMAAAVVRGIQSNNVGTTIKHLAANNQETERKTNDARLTTRALREIYLRGFEIAVKEAHPWMIMTSYNKINGAYTSERRDLLKDIVRGEWGFDGVFMTDFNGAGWAPWQIKAGNDLIMPGTTYLVENVINAVNNRSLDIKDLDFCVKNILNYVVKTNHFKGYKYTKSPDLVLNAQKAREVATEGIVMLKNDNTLPFAETTNVALFGVSSYDLQVTGNGSGNVKSDSVVGLSEGLKNNNRKLADFYKNYISDEKSKMPKQKIFSGKVQIAGETQPSLELINTAAAESDIAIFSIGRNAGEGYDRKPVKGDWSLSDLELDLLKNITKAFHAAGKKVVVLLNVNGVVETSSWKDIPDAILVVWLPGQEGGNAIADILTGRVNPSGKLCSTFPISYFDAPSSKNFPFDYVLPPKKQAFDYATTMTLMDAGKTMREEKPKEEWVKNVDYTNYEEDIYVGYRYYDIFKREVSYPFGYGMSYTTFGYSKPIIKKNNQGFEVQVEVKNTGKFAGKEIVQVYASSPIHPAGQPEKELIAFAKSRKLEPGESQVVTMTFSQKDLAWYDDSRTAWVLSAGNYDIKCASSSRDIRSSTTIKIAKETIVEKTTNSVRPQVNLQLLKP
jgi:beta-glucosidase